MKFATLIQTVACVGAVAVAALPGAFGHNVDRLRPRHSTGGEVTKTVFLTVSYGPSTTVVFGPDPTSTSEPCTDIESTSTSTSLATSAIVSTLTFTTEVETTILPWTTTETSSSSSTSSTSSSTSSSSSSSSEPTSTSSSPIPAPTSTDPNWNPITAPALGGGNAVLAQNAADAQALNRKFRELSFRDKCTNGERGCIADTLAECLGVWEVRFCRTPQSKCRAVPRMQTSGVAIGCYTDEDVAARIASTGQPGNAFGE